MNTDHTHEEQDESSRRLFQDQLEGKAVRQFPHGRLGPNDDGVIAYGMATDVRRGVIHIGFPKPVEHVGLDLRSAEQLREELTRRIAVLRAAGCQ